MTAIYKRELRAFFTSVMGWLFMAVNFFVMSIHIVVYNFMMGYPTISYVLQYVVFLFNMTIPILTMRSLSDERRNKTDQLILTVPVSVGKIVLGKYLAMVTVIAVPIAYAGFVPLFLMQAGEFQTGVSYASLLGFFLYGCLMLAVGLFLSSLTESVVIAAVLSFGAMFLGYIMGGICNIISDFGTTGFAKGVAGVLSCFDMVSRFDILSSGYFEIEAVVYYLTAIGLALFCTAQSIQKRRYSVSGKGIRLGAYSVTGILVMTGLTVAVNVLLNYVPERYTSFDVTSNDLYTLTEETKEFIQGLQSDVTIYVLAGETGKNEDLDKTLMRMAELSGHVSVEYVDPMVNPKFYYNYTDTEPTGNSLIVVCGDRSTVVDYNNIYTYEMNYNTYNYETTGYDGEGQLVSAITYVTTEDMPKFYLVTGHGELAFEESFLSAIKKENVAYEELALYAADEIPEDAQGIIITAPTSDFSADDADKVIAYLEKGGNALLVPTVVDVEMTNFERILAYYGVSVVDGVIVEGDRNHYYQNPYYLFPVIESDSVTQQVIEGAIFSPFSRGLSYDDMADGIYYTPLLTTTESSFSKNGAAGGEDFSRQEGDIDGPFAVSLKAEKETAAGELSEAFFVASESLFTETADDMAPGNNEKLFCAMISSLADHESVVGIPAKSFSMSPLVFSAQTVLVVSIVCNIVVPLMLLVIGIVIWARRRKR